MCLPPELAPVVPIIAPPVIQVAPEPAKQMVQTVEPAPAPVMQAAMPAVVETKTPPLPKVTEAPKVMKPSPPAVVEATVPTMTLAAKVAGGTPTESSITAKVDFEKQVLPLLERSCFECHSSKQKKPKGDVRFDDLEAIREKSRTDNLLFPHKPEKSTLVKSISRSPDHDDVMPPKDEGAADERRGDCFDPPLGGGGRELRHLDLHACSRGAGLDTKRSSGCSPGPGHSAAH